MAVAGLMLLKTQRVLNVLAADAGRHSLPTEQVRKAGPEDNNTKTGRRINGTDLHGLGCWSTDNVFRTKNLRLQVRSQFGPQTAQAHRGHPLRHTATPRLAPALERKRLIRGSGTTAMMSNFSFIGQLTARAIPNPNF